MVIQILKENELKQFKDAFYKIFNSNDPFGQMFNDSIEKRMILCPLDGFCLTKEQFEALVGAINTVGDTKINVSEVESETDCFAVQGNNDKYQCQHWRLDKGILYNEYFRLPIIVENAIFSPNGKWGILISHEEHAVIGGTDEFINAFKELYPLWEEGQKNFEMQWNYNKNEYRSDVDWISKFINHVNNR